MAGKNNVRKLAVVGAGIMGSGIAQSNLLARYERVVLCDIDTSQLQKARVATEQLMKALEMPESFAEYNANRGFRMMGGDALARYEENRKAIMAGRTASEILSHFIYETDLKRAVADADFVIEAVSEKMPLKQEIFRQLGEFTPSHTVCASNTSTMPVTQIALKSKRPEKVIGMHHHGFTQVFNRLIEIMGGQKTAKESLEIGRVVGESEPGIAGKRLVVVLDKEVEGFIANRIAAPAGIYGTWLSDQAAAQGITPQQMHAAGFSMLVGEMVGWDTALDCGISYHDYISPDFGPSQATRELVKQGRLGRKTGHGIFDWDANGRPIITVTQPDEKTLDFVRKNADPEIPLASRLNEACRLLEMGAVKSCEVINEAERVGENHEGIFVLGADKYKQWAEKLEVVAQKIGKPYLKPCEMMRSGKFKDYP